MTHCKRWSKLGVIDVEGIACTIAGSLRIFSLDENDNGSLLVSVGVGNKVVVLVARAFWCTGRFSKGLVDCVLFAYVLMYLCVLNL